MYRKHSHMIYNYFRHQLHRNKISHSQKQLFSVKVDPNISGAFIALSLLSWLSGKKYKKAQFNKFLR